MDLLENYFAVNTNVCVNVVVYWLFLVFILHKRILANSFVVWQEISNFFHSVDWN